ncbi:MAG: hypothetical protein AAFQ80_23425 [Cyanobacteria bacterium J06621_8]
MPDINAIVLAMGRDNVLDIFSSLIEHSNSNPLLAGGLISIGTIFALAYFVKNLNS